MKYLKRKTRQIVNVLTISTIGWILLSTFITKIPALKAELPSHLTNQAIQLLIAHPDDEVMFFTPTITELLKPRYNNTLSVTCFSNGNDQGLGELRERELIRSLQILGITHYEIINDETKFKDSMDLEWDAVEVSKYVKENTTAILTFDEKGISSHPNHYSLYQGALLTSKPVISLKTWHFYIKYTSTILTNLELIHKYLLIITRLPLDHFSRSDDIVTIYANLPSTVLGFAAMSNAHETQMVWFRYIWFLISRYTHTNELHLYRF